MAPLTSRPSSSSQWRVSIWVLLLTNLLVFQLTWNSRRGDFDDRYELINKNLAALNTPVTASEVKPLSVSSSNDLSSSPWDDYILAPPRGKSLALPSIRVAKEDFKSENIYGGKGDKSHLGGFTDLDHHGVSPAAWKWMVTEVGVHSVLDVGCGRGISTSWFYFHGLDVLCVEGSHDAFENSVLPEPRKQMVEHDFSRGPWWPERTYDAVWCVEFLEHVGRNFQKNYLTAFRKAALIFASHSNWGGHHHVEVHDDNWWIQKFTMMGFVYSPELTQKIRSVASAEKSKGYAPNGLHLNAQHVWLTMKVFINPAVAALPQHAHLLAEPGCFLKREDGIRVNRECGEGGQKSAEMESVLPPEYRALPLTQEQDDKWFEHIKARVIQKDPKIEDDKLKKLAQNQRKKRQIEALRNVGNTQSTE